MFQRLDVRRHMRRWEFHRAGRARGLSLAQRWARAVGPAAARTRVRRFRRGVLYVAVESSALLAELGTHRRAEVLARLRSDGSTPAVTDMRLSIGAVGPLRAKGAGPGSTHP